MANPPIRFYKGTVRVGNETQDFAHKPGQTMPNMGILLDEKNLEYNRPDPDGEYWYDNRRMSIVLAICGGADPFVVWKRCVFTERTATGEIRLSEYCYSGDYCRTLNDALLAYEDRR